MTYLAGGGGGDDSGHGERTGCSASSAAFRAIRTLCGIWGRGSGLVVDVEGTSGFSSSGSSLTSALEEERKTLSRSYQYTNGDDLPSWGRRWG